MDVHTASAPIQKNLPALLAAFSYWNIENLAISSFCFLPYDERLTTLVPWLQQLEMESLGKSKRGKGEKISEKTVFLCGEVMAMSHNTRFINSFEKAQQGQH